MHLSEPVAGYVSIDFGRANAGVAEQLLNHPQVGAIFQQMRCETVPEHVRRDVAPNARPPHPSFDPQPERHRREWPAAIVEENSRGGMWFHQFWPAPVNVTLQSRYRHAAQRHYPLFIALADHIDKTCLQMQLLQPGIAQFRQAQS